MKRDEFERIANDELDGIATPAEREALRRHLAESASAREHFEALRVVFVRLKNVGLEEAPPDLKPSVARAIVAQRREPVPVKRSAGWMEWVGGLFRAPNLRSALTFASGVGVGAAAIAIVAGNLVGSGHVETSALSGTMAPRSTAAGERAVSTERLQLNGITVTADTRRTSDGVLLRLVATGDGASGAELTAAFGGALHPVALRMEPPSAGEFEVGASEVRVRLAGEGAWVLSLRSEAAHPAPLELELRAGGRSARAELKTDSSESR
jgi:hypothetical protein